MLFKLSVFCQALTLPLQGLVDTVVFHIDAITGADSTGRSTDGAIFEGHDIIQGPLVEGYLLNAETKVVVLLDEFLQVHYYLFSLMAGFNSHICVGLSLPRQPPNTSCVCQCRTPFIFPPAGQRRRPPTSHGPRNRLIGYRA